MMFPVAANERERLDALRELRIIDTDADPVLDRICELSREMLDVPVAIVSLLDENEQWFKSRSGIDLDRTSREVAFCNYTLLGDEPFVVEDACRDPRFARNPLVTGEQHVRAYAGVPLAITPGLNIGTLCCIDTDPRSFSVRERRMLADLGAVVLGQFRLHQANLKVEDQAIVLRDRNAILARMEQFACVGGFELDLATRHLSWSDNLYRLYDMRPGEGTSVEIALAAYSAQDRAKIVRMLDTLTSDTSYDGELAFTSVTGTKRWVRLRWEVVAAQGRPSKLTGILQDVSERRAAEAKMAWTSLHDPLTELPNRQLLTHELEKALDHARLAGSKLGLLFVDIDRFKEVNNTLGHAAGDALLRIAAERLSDVAGPSNLVARHGGDEFAVIVHPVQSVAEMDEVARRIVARLGEPAMHDGMQLNLRASVGVSVFPQPARNSLELLTQADMALYAAKAAGKDRLAFYNPMMRTKMQRRAGMLGRAQEALDRGSVVPFYQPKVSLATGEITGFEALLRIVEDGTIHPPAAILDAFDDAALSVRIGERMLDRIVTQMRDWTVAGLRFGSVALNVGAAEFSTSLAENVLGRLADAKLGPECLEIEVTESVFLGDRSEQVGAVLTAFHAAGVMIALDDFGTGYASLSHLRKFPVSWLKIDRSFVSGIDAEPEAAAIVDAVAGLARSLGIGIVAEGVETEGQLRFLRDRKCEVGQGYLFGKPMAGARVPGFLKNWRPEQAL